MADQSHVLDGLKSAERTLYKTLTDEDHVLAGEPVTLQPSTETAIAEALAELSRRRTDPFGVRGALSAAGLTALARASSRTDILAVDGPEPTLSDARDVARSALIAHALGYDLAEVDESRTLRNLAEAVGRLDALAANEARQPSPVEERLDDLLKRALDVVDAASALPGDYFEGQRLVGLREALERLNEGLAP